MNTLRWLIALLTSAVSASAEITFEGYTVVGDRSLFVLSTDKRVSSGWLSIGGVFDGFKIVAFDSKAGILTVEKFGGQTRLQLAEGKVQIERPVSRNKGNPIVLNFGPNQVFVVDSGPAGLSALKTQLTAMAAATPTPTVAIQIPGVDFDPKSAEAAIALIKETGIPIRRVELVQRGPNETQPETKTPSVENRLRRLDEDAARARKRALDELFKEQNRRLQAAPAPVTPPAAQESRQP